MGSHPRTGEELTPALPGEDRRWIDTSTLAALDSFLAVGVLGIYLKLAFLGQQWGAVARFLGKTNPQQLTALERLGFFSDDIALNLLVVPLVATVVVCVLFRRLRVVAALVISVAVTLLYFVELRAQAEVGQYLTREAMSDLVGFAAATPELGRNYVTAASVIKLAVLLTTLVAIAVLGAIGQRAEGRGRASVGRPLLLWPAAVLLAVALVLTPLAFVHQLPDSLLNRSAVARVVSTLTARNGADASTGALNFEQLLHLSRQQTRTPPIDPAHALVGHERDSDLIVFMMETGPAQALDLAIAAPQLPGAGPLYPRSFVASRHYTTYPYSSDAMYSFLSGMYPQGRRRVLRASQGRPLNGLMSALRQDVPVRRVYVPSLYHLELDQPMYAAFGADLLYAADEQLGDPLRSAGEQRADALLAAFEREGAVLSTAERALLRARLRADFQALEKVKADISECVRANRRYAVMYFPEVGHAPWLPIHGERTPVERGRALMVLQDGWLKEIVDTVRGLGRLDRTVIAVTADHGIRTRVEDPALPTGTVSDYMFRVPLLVYAPQTLRQPFVTSAPTSHLDFTPTLLALFGRTGAASRMQGVPLWQRTSRNRIFFFASAYGGADGFTEEDRFYMRQVLSGAVYSNSELAFGDANQVRPGDPLIPFVKDAVARAESLQQSIAAKTPVAY